MPSDTIGDHMLYHLLNTLLIHVQLIGASMLLLILCYLNLYIYTDLTDCLFGVQGECHDDWYIKVRRLYITYFISIQTFMLSYRKHTCKSYIMCSVIKCITLGEWCYDCQPVSLLSVVHEDIVNTVNRWISKLVWVVLFNISDLHSL